MISNTKINTGSGECWHNNKILSRYITSMHTGTNDGRTTDSQN